MSQWERRLSRDSSPRRRLEHELRYALVAPLIREAELWVDLGCGRGGAAAGALAGEPTAQALLVDLDEAALERAGRELPGARTLRADLGNAEGTAAVRDAVGQAEATVTCFEAIAHLEDFVPCVELLLDLGARCTVVLSVPNDAFWSIENAHHHTMWGEGAFDELRRLVPDDHVALEQVPLAGSAIVGAGDAELALTPARVPADRVASHFLLAFGPRAQRLAPLAHARAVDADGQRRFDRERDSELAVLAGRVAELEQAR
jgi:SAM-dependent methyltransferase